MANLRVAVIGAGASGILSVIKLREAGIEDIVLFEKGATLGGTWRDNRYPGLACDVASHAYRFSFAPNPNWTMVCSPGGEILEYLQRTADEHNVESYIHYNSEVSEAEFIDNKWHITTNQGPQGAFDAVITATGVLHYPMYPNIEGLDTFAGDCFHTARWPEGEDLKGKRVGMIGAGSTGTQLAGGIVDDVSELNVFARTPQWITPFVNYAYTEEQKERYRTDPAKMQYDYDNLSYKANYEFGSAMVGENPEAYDKIVEACEGYLATVKDPELRAKLTPDYKVGCKRLVVSGSYYETLQKPHVNYIDEGIERIDATGILTKDGKHHEFDVLIIATGYDTHAGYGSMKVTGPDGVTITDAWAERSQGYKTVTAAGFPNWFMLGGPTSPVGNFSWLRTAETQHAFIVRLLQKLQSGEAETIAPKAEATQRFNDAVREQLPKTIWMSGCGSWYIDKNGDASLWPWTWEKFIQDMSEPVWEDFEIS